MVTKGDGVSVSNPIFARVYKRLAASMERHGGEEHRRRLLAGLEGRVLEVGCGHGPNFRHYPSTVTELVAVEPERHLLADARRAAVHAPVPTTVHDAPAERLPLDDDSVDAAVVSLVLCSVVDPVAAARELARVVRPGGQLRFYEHVRSTNPRLARRQDRFDVVWPRLAAGCHTSRDTLATLTDAGFEVEEVDRFRFPETRRIVFPTSPHVLGRATLGADG
jgi:ubiquinone/menaquinone biosynthesis C-methylase UbiE